MSTIEKKNDQETLSLLPRMAEAIFVICMILLFGFLLSHQINNTSFFTEKFSALEMFCLYGPLIFGMSPLVIRAWTGQRQLARPFEAATSLFLALGSLWLVIVFPFNYAHLGAVLPESLRFTVAWVTDDIARIVLLLQVVISPISALLTFWKYLSIRQQETPQRRML